MTARDANKVGDLVKIDEANALPLNLDVTDQAQIAHTVAKAEEHFGRIDVSVNNAGFGYFGTVEESDEAEIRSMFEMNFWELSVMTRAVLPKMRERKAIIQEIIFERQSVSEKRHKNRSFYSSYDFFDSDAQDYSNLGENFDELINESDEEEIAAEPTRPKIDFLKIYQPVEPVTVLTCSEPKLLPAPLFVEFRRTAIFNLNSPTAFRGDLFETAIEKNFLSQMIISSSGASFTWETRNEDKLSWRELNLPMIGWKVAYTINGNELILSNDADFLKKIMTTQNYQNNKIFDSPFTELTVLNLDEREQYYNQIFAKLSEKNSVSNFFTGNVESVLNAASDIKNVEIRRNYSGNFLNEEVTLSFRIPDKK